MYRWISWIFSEACRVVFTYMYIFKKKRSFVLKAWNFFHAHRFLEIGASNQCHISTAMCTSGKVTSELKIDFIKYLLHAITCTCMYYAIMYVYNVC